MIGWTWNSKSALRNTVAASSANEPPVRAWVPASKGSPTARISER